MKPEHVTTERSGGACKLIRKAARKKEERRKEIRNERE